MKKLIRDNGLVLFLCAVSILLLAGQAQAATEFSFSPEKITVKPGQAFSIKIGVIPSGVPNFTVKTGVKFPADLVSFKTWAYASDWMPLKKSSYDDSYNNFSGVLLKTAGYPEGFSTTTNFGIAVFTAKKSGTGAIIFTSDSRALDKNKANLYGGGNQVVVDITSAGNTSATTGVKLFDIILTIENALLDKASDLVARTQFTSFGTVPTLVDMVYRIENAGGKEVFSETGEVTVETEQIVTKEFKNLALGKGKYTLILATTYGNSVKDEFRQALEVKGVVAKTGIRAWVWIVSILGIIGIAGLMVYLFLYFSFYNNEKEDQ